jgi:hypothetical protein
LSYKHWFSSVAIPNFGRAMELAVRTETQRQLTRAAIGLRRYQLQQGKPAPDLQSLVPEQLSTLPWDYMSGQPLVYRLTEAGEPLLYSVGEDGADHQGDPSPPQPVKDFDLWTGRDAVWPQPD